MGKDLTGKELGTGIVQVKNGQYIARITTQNGTRKGKRFNTVQECREWLVDEEYNKQHNNLQSLNQMSLNAWFDFWIGTKQQMLKASTIRSYRNIYNSHIKNVIGFMLVVDIKPIHCQTVLNQMAEKGLGRGTIGNAKRVLFGLFEIAYINDVILSNPCRKGVTARIGKNIVPKEALTLEEQKRFLEAIKHCRYRYQYRFILQTGLRVGELTGLKWSDIDFVNKTISVQRTAEYNADTKQWDITDTKTQAGNRIVPLTTEALNILAQQKKKNALIKVVPIQWRDYVFLTTKGRPSHTSSYNASLDLICKKIGIKHISMHILRHTFATRCMEGGMKPKILQVILGHADIKTTMNLYVHTTIEEKRKEIDLVENVLAL